MGAGMKCQKVLCYAEGRRQVSLLRFRATLVTLSRDAFFGECIGKLAMLRFRATLVTLPRDTCFAFRCGALSGFLSWICRGSVMGYLGDTMVLHHLWVSLGPLLGLSWSLQPSLASLGPFSS